MKENWEITWKDYYKILQLDPAAEAEVVEGAFTRLSKKYHPDVNHDPRASERMKELNEAHDILGNMEKRKQYHSAYLLRMRSGRSTNIPPPPSPPTPSPIKPKPEVNPTVIRFLDLIPGDTRKDTFIVKNSGGPYSKIYMSNPSSWLSIVSQKPLYGTGKLPLFVEIEVKGDEWGKTYIDNIIIKFDDIETHVRVELQTRPKPNIESVPEWTVCQTCTKNGSAACPYGNQPAITRDGRINRNDLCDAYLDSAKAVHPDNQTIDPKEILDNSKSENYINSKKRRKWIRTNPQTTERLIQPVGSLALTFIGILGIPSGLIYGIVKLFTTTQNHLAYFSPALMCFIVFCAFIVDYNKGGKRGNLLVLWTLGCISALAAIYIPVVRWFFIGLAVVVAIIIFVRYNNPSQKSERNPIGRKRS